ncbi:MAG: GTPase Era [Lentisphaerae bacterium]|nr:GTPase Era [Lentisphaerota bacterium]MBT4820585.1 GTPase Era [Lentisphaerota bacterium]MBT5611482.1 GTPase Era [Lentisphaerota bacterium]MBT7056344.1 GTPase Era [Lentisphaerota bacterium]MBT7842980.1 GTPase Era [Lentisphaerota bacterium]
MPSPPDWPTGQVGYVALLGRPNTGKSTLLNTLLELRIAAVSAKPQTTRRQLLGIYSDANTQLLFLDVPGVHRPKHALDEAMSHIIGRALEDADIILCMADPTRPQGDEDSLVAELAASAEQPVVLCVNKSDIASAEELDAAEAFYLERLGSDTPACRVCSLRRPALEPLLAKLLPLLPAGPFFYSGDEVTDVFERDLAVDLIREVLLEELREEVPHTMAVEIDSWKDTGKRSRVEAVLYVEHDRHKGIVLGRKGSMLRHLQKRAGARLSALCDRPVELRFWVKVAADWRKRSRRVQDFGYGGRK